MGTDDPGDAGHQYVNTLPVQGMPGSSAEE